MNNSKNRAGCTTGLPVSKMTKTLLSVLLAFTGWGSAAHAQAPTVTALNPAHGDTSAIIRISGSNFNTTPPDNIVFFGATRALVTGGTDDTSLTVEVPIGATHSPVSVLNPVNNLLGYSPNAFLPVYENRAYISQTINFNPGGDVSTNTAPKGIAIGDVDGDGRPDLVVVNTDASTVGIYLNTGSGTFAAPVELTSISSPRHVAIGDMNGDGKPDLAITSEGADEVVVFFNSSTSGSVSFGGRINCPVAASPYDVVIGDIDNDGKADIAATSGTTTSVSVLRNISAGTPAFDAAVTLTAGNHTTGLALGDIDGDGKADLAVVNQNDNNISLFHNVSTSGSIVFDAPANYSAGSIPLGIAIGDLDGDGKLDLAVTNRAGNTVSVYHNNSSGGTMTLAGKVDFAVGVNCQGIGIGDINGDGKPDLAVANHDANTISVLKNTSEPGSITFAPNVDFPTGSAPQGIAVGDLDGDGKPDVVNTNSGSNTFSLFINHPFDLVITPTAITKNVSAGFGHSLFLKSDSTVWAAGFNLYGQLGDSTDVDRSTAVRVRGLTGIVAVSAGYYFSLFLKSDSTVWACGQNFYGQLGNGTEDEQWAPVQVIGLTGITAIAAGADHSLFLKKDSTVWAAGANCCGQLGIGSYDSKDTAVQIPTLSGITAIAAGDGHSLFLKSNGTVWAAGDNLRGQLGIGESVEMSNIPVQVQDAFSITAIAAGYDHSLFLKKDSTVLATGGNGFSNLGDGTTIDRFTPVPVHVITGVTKIEAGLFASFFLKSDSTAWGIGFNQGGLGNGNYDSQDTLVKVIGLDHVSDLTNGDGFSLFVEAGCGVFTTGYNNTGQLADGTNNDRALAEYALSLCTDCTPDVSNFTATTATSPCLGASSAVVFHSTTLMADTTYTVNYTLSGAGGNTGTFTSAPFVYGNDTGAFIIDSTNLINAGATTVTINYISNSSCNSETPASGNVANFTVNALPVATAGNNGPVCAGDTLDLTSDAPGGAAPLVYSWAGPNSFSSVSQNPSIVPATVAASGTYTVIVTDNNGCADTANTSATINANPVITSINSNAPVCEGKTLSLSSTVTGGTSGYDYMWSGPESFTSAVANPTVSTSVTDDEGGTYQLIVADGNHCADTATTLVTIYPIQPIVGSDTVTFGQTITLSDPVAGGTWSTPTPWVTKVTAGTGEVKGVSASVSEISYTTTYGCVATHTVTVLSGINACVGQTLVISDGIAAGGTWTSNSNSIATVGLTTGIITGVAAGTTVITHRLSPSVMTTTTVKVNPLAVISSGVNSVCQGQTLALTNGTVGGGTWYSGNTATAVVNSSGTVTGLSGGNVVIYFTPVAGCVTTKTITINPVTPITGPTSVCVSQTIALTNTAGGGTWSTSNGSLATVASGIVGGVAAGTPTISYKWPNGCFATSAITVKALSQITGGTTVICQNATTALTNATSGGGNWSSDSKFTVNSSGVATAVGTGTGYIYFTANNGCVATRTITVNPSPVIGGVPAVCVGQTTLLSSSMTGGTWSTTNAAQATVYNGLVGGVAASTPTISYKLPSGCFGTASVIVRPLSPISGGSTSICPTGTTVFTNGTPGGGVWGSSQPSVATVNSSGLVTGAGAAAGSKTEISFTTNANGCIATRTVTIVACREGATTIVDDATVSDFNVQLFPNPNRGVFTLKGTVVLPGDEEAHVEVVNMLGQVIYRGRIRVVNGYVDERIQMAENLAPGMYMLNLHTDAARKLFHFVIGQ